MRIFSLFSLALAAILATFAYEAEPYYAPIEVGGRSPFPYPTVVNGEMRVTMDFPVLVASDGTWPATNTLAGTIDDTTDIVAFYFSTDNSAFEQAKSYEHPFIPDSTVDVITYRFINGNGTGPWIELNEATDEACNGITWQRGILSRWTHGTPQPFCQPVTTGTSAGEITTGAVTVEFMYVIGADSLTSAYSIDDADWVRAGYSYVRDSFDLPGDFTNRVWKDDQGVLFNYNADEAFTVETDPTSIANGLTILGTPVPHEAGGVKEVAMKSACIDCHSHVDSDRLSPDLLAIYSPAEINYRCQFHGFTAGECSDAIAALVDQAETLGQYDWQDRPGRRYFMFLAARPGADTLATIPWMTGTTWRQVLNDDEMYTEMYDAVASEYDVHWETIYERMNPRETRHSLPVFTWNKWLPRKGMPDVLGSQAAWYADECYTYFSTVKGKYDAWLGGSTSLVTYGGESRSFGADEWYKNKCLGRLDDSDPQGNVSWQHQLDRYALRAFLSNTYYWYLATELNNSGTPLFDSTAVITFPPETINGETATSGIFRSVPTTRQYTFGRAPHRDHTQYNLSEGSIHYSSYSGYNPTPTNYTGGPTESAQWYAVYLTHNLCARMNLDEPTACDDQKYTMDHLRTLAEQGSTFGQAALTLNLKVFGNMTNRRGIATGGGRMPRHDWISNFVIPAAYGNVNGCGDWTATQCRLHFNVVFREFNHVYGVFSRSDIPASRYDHNNSNLDYGTANITTTGSWSDATNGGATVTTPSCPAANGDPDTDALYVFQFSTSKNYVYGAKCAIKHLALIGGTKEIADTLNTWLTALYPGSGSNNFLVEASFSTPATPGAVTLSSPANAATGVALDVTLSWSSASDATSYTLQYDTDSGFGSATTVPLIVGTSYQPNFTEASVGSTIYWRVRGDNSGGSGSYSTARSFTLVNPSSWSFGFPNNGTFSEAGSSIALADTAGSGTVWAWFGALASGEVFSAEVDSAYKPASNYFEDGFGITVADTSSAFGQSTVDYMTARFTGSSWKLLWRYQSASQAYDSVKTFASNTTPKCIKFTATTSGSNTVVTPQWANNVGGSCGTFSNISWTKTGEEHVISFVRPSANTITAGVSAQSRTTHADVRGHGKNAAVQ